MIQPVPVEDDALWRLVRAKVAAMLHVDETQIDAHATFRELKFDSLDLVELQMDLEQALNLDLLEGSLRQQNVMDLRLDALVAHLKAAKT